MPGSFLEKSLRVGRSIYRARIGEIFRRALPFGIGAVAILHEYDYLKSIWWMWGWLAGFALSQLFDAYFAALTNEASDTRVERVHGSLAGAIDNVTLQLVQHADRRLDEASCKALCVGLLSRIAEYAEHVLQPGDKNQLRASLAVPLNDPTTPQDALRVWCYDRPHPDRRWSIIPMNHSGAAVAFRLGSVEIISDVQTVIEIKDRFAKKFRSVVCFAVKAGGPNGQSLGVVSLDSTVPGFFNDTNIQHLIPLIASPLNLISLAILTRDPGAAYVFAG